MALLSSVRIRLAKAAVDNGFDIELSTEGEWLGFGSSDVKLRIWLTALGDTVMLAAFSQPNVLRALAGMGTPFSSPMPSGACGALGVTDYAALHRILRRAPQLSRTLPDELWKVFAEKAEGMPRETEAERFVVQRVGQDVFRDGLLDYWDGRCAMSGLAVPELLRASHIKPWAACERDEERLDVFNGLLLAAHLDAAFDKGLITVSDDGVVLVSSALDAVARALLGLDRPMKVPGIVQGHRGYLPFHRGSLFRP